MKRVLLVIVVGSACGVQGQAGSGDEAVERPGSRPGLLSISSENDGPLHAVAFGDDRHYTNGVSIEASLLPNGAAYDRYLRWLDVFDEFDRPRSAVGVSARQTIYTPEDIDVAANQPGDWPYNGLATAGVFVQRREGAVFDHVQLEVGVMGQDAGGQPAQEWVHAVLPRQVNPSWAGQVANQLAVQGHYQRRWRLRWERDADGELRRALSDAFDGEADSGMERSPAGFELIPYVGARVGTVFVDGSFGAIARYGWPLPDDFGPPRLYEFTDHTSRGSDGFGFSIFARAGARVVAHNALLRGSVFDSPRLDEKELVGEFHVGMHFQWDSFELGYSQTLVTEEFEGQNSGNRTGTWTFIWNLAH
ncbi:MAG: lipid A deacylase LpxR family protein [Planctomycetota bacterium]